MLQFEPIGTVHNSIREASRDTPWREIESDIVLDRQWQDALLGLGEFSHIWVVFAFHLMPPPETLQIRPMQRQDMPLVGRFATRSPQRPNPIGITAVELLEVRGTLLRVRGLDALDGTPVLDIKPYLERGDALQETRVGKWVKIYWNTQPPEA